VQKIKKLTERVIVMGLMDKYGGVKKRGYQLYKKNCLLIDKKLADKEWNNIEKYFTTEKNDLNLVFYLGGSGITATYTDYYCSNEDFKKHIEKILKGKGILE